MQLDEAKEILENNGYLLKENNYEVEGVPTKKVYIVIMDDGETNDDYAVFRDIIAAQNWGDKNCKYDYTVKISKMF